MQLLKNIENYIEHIVLIAVFTLLSMVAYGSDVLDNSFLKFAIENLDILPRPIGIKYDFERATKELFGFGDEEFLNNYGFGVGRFTDA